MNSSKRRLSLLAVPVLLLAACGGDDDSASDAGGGGSAEAWCEFARSVEEIDSELDEVDPFDPEGVEQTYGRFRTAIGDARAIAPDEIDDAVDTVYEGVVRIDEELAAVDYNFMDLDLAFMDDLETDMEDASQQIEEYNQRECGIPAEGDEGGTEVTAVVEDDAVQTPGSAEGELEFDPSEGSVREQIIQSFVMSGFTEAEAGCLADNLDFAALEEEEPDPTAMLEIFETCDIDFERLAELGGG